jgi:hypothetical protein
MDTNDRTLWDAAEALRTADPGDLAEELPDEVLQGAMTQLVKAYLVKRETGGDFLPVTSQVTATEASVAASGIMDAADLEFFELTLWNSWGRV